MIIGYPAPDVRFLAGIAQGVENLFDEVDALLSTA